MSERVCVCVWELLRAGVCDGGIYGRGWKLYLLHWKPVRLPLRRLAGVIYGELTITCARGRARAYTCVHRGSTEVLHHPLTFLSPPLPWPPAWVNAEAPSPHLLAALFVCQPSPAQTPPPSPLSIFAHAPRCKRIISAAQISQLNSM